MKSTKSISIGALLVAFVLLQSACSSGASDETNAVATTTSEVGTTTTTVAPAVLAFPYFEELAKDTRVGYEAAMKMATGSALEYAQYQNEFLQAIAYDSADGQIYQEDPLETARLDESGRILVESTEKRIIYSDFVFANGKLVDFDVEGRKLSSNLRRGAASYEYSCYTGDGACESADSMDLEILHSYVSAAGDLIVTYTFRIGSKHSIAREDRTSNRLPNHEVVDSKGTRIKAKFGAETFAIGDTRVNVVAFGPLSGGGTYTAIFRFRSDGYLYEYKNYVLGTFAG